MTGLQDMLDRARAIREPAPTWRDRVVSAWYAIVMMAWAILASLIAARWALAAIPWDEPFWVRVGLWYVIFLPIYRVAERTLLSWAAGEHGGD